MSRLRWCVELWISSDTLFSRSCLARLPNTNSMASITLDLPEPLGPTTEEKDCGMRSMGKGRLGLRLSRAGEANL